MAKIIVTLIAEEKGSSKSGNYNHAGRPGKLGGSVPKGSGAITGTYDISKPEVVQAQVAKFSPQTKASYDAMLATLRDKYPSDSADQLARTAYEYHKGLITEQELHNQYPELAKPLMSKPGAGAGGIGMDASIEKLRAIGDATPSNMFIKSADVKAIIRESGNQRLIDALSVMEQTNKPMKKLDQETKAEAAFRHAINEGTVRDLPKQSTNPVQKVVASQVGVKKLVVGR